MAVAYDATGGGASSGGTGSRSWSHTATGSNRCVIVAIAVGSGGSGSFTNYTRSVTYGGTSMTSRGAINSGGGTTGFVELFYLLSPATGAQTVAVTTSQSQGSLICNSVSYTGVGSVGTLASASPTSGAPSLTVSSASGRRAIAAFASGKAISTPTQTQRYLNNLDTNSAAGNVLIQDAAGAASVTFGAANNSDWWGLVGVDLIAASAPANTGQFFSMF